MGNKRKKTRFFTPAEAATLLRLHRRTVYDFIRSGRLRAYNFGKSVRIPRRALVEFLKGNRAGPPPRPEKKQKGLTKREREEAQRIMDRLL